MIRVGAERVGDRSVDLHHRYGWRPLRPLACVAMAEQATDLVNSVAGLADAALTTGGKHGAESRRKEHLASRHVRRMSALASEQMPESQQEERAMFMRIDRL